MREFTIDPRNRVQLCEAPTGVTGQISWQRLIDVLRKEGEISPDEKVTSITVTAVWVRYTVEKVK